MATEELTLGPRTWRAVRERVRPSDAEMRWLSAIPWEADLESARAKAAETGRPIMFWAMNGNPLGCV